MTGAPVIVATALATDSRCCTFIVVTTWMPASRRISTSCRRFSRGDPGTFVWASSSTRATVGFAREDRLGVHLLDDHPAILDPPSGHDLEPVEERQGVRPPVRLHEPDDEVRATGHAPVALLEHPVRLADPGRHAEIDAETATPRAGFRLNPGEHLLGRRADVERVVFLIRHSTITG